MIPTTQEAGLWEGGEDVEGSGGEERVSLLFRVVTTLEPIGIIKVHHDSEEVTVGCCAARAVTLDIGIWVTAHMIVGPRLSNGLFGGGVLVLGEEMLEPIRVVHFHGHGDVEIRGEEGPKLIQKIFGARAGLSMLMVMGVGVC